MWVDAYGAIILAPSQVFRSRLKNNAGRLRMTLFDTPRLLVDFVGT